MLDSVAVFQSSSALSPWAITDTEEMDRRTVKLGNLVNCKNDSDRDVFMECLRSAKPSGLVNNEFNVASLSVVDFPFTPIVDGTFLLEHPNESVKKGDFKNTSLLTGSNVNEGLFFILYFLTELFRMEENVTVTREQFLKAVKDTHHKLSPLQIEALTFEVKCVFGSLLTIATAITTDYISIYRSECLTRRIYDTYWP